MDSESLFDQILERWSRDDFEHMLEYDTLPAWIPLGPLSIVDAGPWFVCSDDGLLRSDIVCQVTEPDQPDSYFCIRLIACGDSGEMELIFGECVSTAIYEVFPKQITKTIYEAI